MPVQTGSRYHSPKPMVGTGPVGEVARLGG
jgi:hypothetical protein